MHIKYKVIANFRFKYIFLWLSIEIPIGLIKDITQPDISGICTTQCIFLGFFSTFHNFNLL